MDDNAPGQLTFGFTRTRAEWQQLAELRLGELKTVVFSEDDLAALRRLSADIDANLVLHYSLPADLDSAPRSTA